MYLYDCLLVAIALLCPWYKSYTDTVSKGKLCGIKYFKSIFLTMYQCAHTVNFPWPDHIYV